MTKPEIRFYNTAEDLAKAAAQAWAEELETIADLTSYCCALSGGRIANSFYSAIVALPEAARRRFREIHYFWADERCVPPDDPESNYLTAAKLLFEPLRVAEKRIHRIRGEENPAKAAEMAAAELKATVTRTKEQIPVLDMAILGLGEDGHTASLFPGEPEEVRKQPAVYRAVVGPKPPPNRVTLGYNALASTRRVFMLANGAGKAAALQKSLASEGQTPFGCLLNLRRQNLAAGEIIPIATIFTDVLL